MHLVSAGKNTAKANLAAPVGDRVIRSGEGNYHGAHLRMNVAEDERYAWLVESDKLS